MQVRIEFLGISRLVTGEKEIALTLEKNTTFYDIVQMLAKEYPALVGNVIQPDLKTLQAPNIFNLNARRMIQKSQMGSSPDDNDRIILMSMSAGG